MCALRCLHSCGSDCALFMLCNIHMLTLCDCNLHLGNVSFSAPRLAARWPRAHFRIFQQLPCFSKNTDIPSTPRRTADRTESGGPQRHKAHKQQASTIVVIPIPSTRASLARYGPKPCVFGVLGPIPLRLSVLAFWVGLGGVRFGVLTKTTQNAR